MKFFCCFIFLFGTFFTFGQNGSAKKAAKLFLSKQFVAAAKEYQDVSETPLSLSQLGICFFKTNQNVDAIKAFEKLFETYKDSVPLSSYFYAAHAYMKVGDYSLSDPLMSKYLNKTVYTNNFMYDLKSLLPYLYDLQLMTKSNANPNYGMVPFGDQIVYTAAKNELNSTATLSNSPQYDFVVASVNKAGLIFKSELFSKELNSKYHESSPTFSANGKLMFFNRTLQKECSIDEEKHATKAIFSAKLENGIWQDIKPLAFCKKDFSYENPMLSKDGKTLFFASDNDNSIGGFDIFYVKIFEDGSFSDIRNPGGQVNTIHDERSPFVSDDNSVLYFASDGHQGMGGLDIFSSDFLNSEYQNILNLGNTINSSLDDFAFVVDGVLDQGFLTSNREGQNNLYSFTRVKSDINFSIQGNILDRNTKKPIPNVNLLFTNSKGELIPAVTSSSLTEFLYKIKPNSNYKIQVSTPGYYSFDTEIYTTTEKKNRYQIELFRNND